MNQEVTRKRLEWVPVLRQSCSLAKREAGTGIVGHWQIFGTETGKPVQGLRWWVSWQTSGWSPGRPLGSQQGLELGLRVQSSKPNLGPLGGESLSSLCAGGLSLEQHRGLELSFMAPQSVGMEPAGHSRSTQMSLLSLVSAVRTVPKTGCIQGSLEPTRAPWTPAGRWSFTHVLAVWVSSRPSCEPVCFPRHQWAQPL